MAGSYAHIVADDGTFTMELIDNMGDAHEALEECFAMIANLRRLVAELQYTKGSVGFGSSPMRCRGCGKEIGEGCTANCEIDLAKKGEVATCAWTQDGNGSWHTGCGKSFIGGATFSGLNCCYNCGKPVSLESHDDDHDSSEPPMKVGDS